MARPFDVITFDCYGTLIDWETGLLAALPPVAHNEELLERFARHEARLEAGPYLRYSEVLEEFSGGDAEVGIHGNNDASVLGQDVSHGCVRMSNEKITQLVSMLPLGTAVVIEA